MRKAWLTKRVRPGDSEYLRYDGDMDVGVIALLKAEFTQGCRRVLIVVDSSFDTDEEPNVEVIVKQAHRTPR